MSTLLTRRLRTVFLVACCQFAFAECTSADPETVARFREQYPEAGKRIEDVYSHIAISSRYRYFEAGTFGCEVKLDFIRDGSRFRLIKEMLTTFHHSAFGAQDAILVNDSYSFFARSKDPASEMILGSARPASQSRSDGALTLCFEWMKPPPLNLYGFHYGGDWSYSFLNMLDWEGEMGRPGFPATFVDAERIQDGDKEFVKLHCTMLNNRDKAEFTLSPSDQWIVVGYRVESPKITFSGTHEFEGSYKGVPLIKSYEKFVRMIPPGKEEYFETSLKAEVMFIDAEREFPAALFEPEALGVHFVPPDPPANKSRTTLKWPWILLAGSLFALILALYLRQRARQTDATRATAP